MLDSSFLLQICGDFKEIQYRFTGHMPIYLLFTSLLLPWPWTVARESGPGGRYPRRRLSGVFAAAPALQSSWPAGAGPVAHNDTTTSEIDSVRDHTRINESAVSATSRHVAKIAHLSLLVAAEVRS